MSKLNVGVGEEFPVNSAEPNSRDEARNEDGDDICGYGHFRGRGRRFGRFGRHRGPFFLLGPLVIIAFIAMISLAVSNPGITLALIAMAAVAFALRHHGHHWHDDDDGPDDRRDRRDWRDRSDRGPQPDAPDAAASGRS